MYEESLLISHIASATGYKTGYAQAKVADQTDTREDAIRVYIGHVSQKVHQPEAYPDAYRELDNDFMLITQVQLWCKRTELVSAWNNLQAALKGWSPFPDNGNFSSLTFLEANSEATAADKIVWVAYYGLIIPRIA